jgi:hypothetical protein
MTAKKTQQGADEPKKVWDVSTKGFPPEGTEDQYEIVGQTLGDTTQPPAADMPGRPGEPIDTTVRSDASKK